MRQWPAIFTLVLAFTAKAQTRAGNLPNPTLPEPTGAVSGHVFCSDTNEPARFAKVSLERIADPAPLPAPTNGAAGAAPPAGPKTVAPAATNIVETTLDGSFTIPKVKAGSYYVIVEKEGYIKPREMFTQKEIDDPSPQMREIIAGALPRVHIDSTETAQAEVRLERGAAISGTILYDDGSPAAELPVKILHKDASGKWAQVDSTEGPHLGSDAATDDRGYFRQASLLPDEYMVEADMNLADTKISTTGDGDNKMMFAMSEYRFQLPFYGAGFARQKDAASVKLRAGQELTGQDMTIPIAKLHRLSGRVAAGHDAHFVNAAKLSLCTRDDGKELATADISREDGLFHFEFVPTGDYTLKVTNARDVVWEPRKPAPGSPFNPIPMQDKERVLQAYGDTDMPILLDGDMLGVTATVPPDAKPSTSTATP